MENIIILTSTVNINKNIQELLQKDKHVRLDTYLKSISKWLNETNLNIILVENSGYEFNELEFEKNKYKARFEVITYNEENFSEHEILKDNISKGISELFSINYAYNNSKLLKELKDNSKTCDSIFIIKITCRFFIPELENYLKNIKFLKYDCLIQNDKMRCEMLGCNIDQFKKIFNLNLSDIKHLNLIDFIEVIYYNRIIFYAHNPHICKTFHIEPTRRGGIDQIFYDI